MKKPLEKTKNISADKKNGKKIIAIQCVLAVVTVLLAVLSGIYLTKGALAQASKNFTENSVKAAPDARHALPLSLKEGNSADAISVWFLRTPLSKAVSSERKEKPNLPLHSFTITVLNSKTVLLRIPTRKSPRDTIPFTLRDTNGTA